MVETYASNLREFYINNCLDNEGADWYTVYTGWLSSFEGDYMLNCAMFSLMSINSSLSGNISKFEHWHTTGEFKGLCPNKFKQLIDESSFTEIDYLRILNGKKISNFFMNLYQPDSPDWCTIDRHQYRICGEFRSKTNLRYERIVEAHQIVADEFELIANELQATCWIKYRKLKNENNR